MASPNSNMYTSKAKGDYAGQRADALACTLSGILTLTARESTDFSDSDLHTLFCDNYYVKYERREKSLILVKGGSSSRLLNMSNQ